MIYTFGCSVTKWYWPTWADWLSVYKGPVTNLAYKGYGNDNIYWTLFQTLPKITKNDHVIIMWSQSHRLNYWYDRQWIDEQDILGFFPDTDGKLWHTRTAPYVGMYRTHPEYQPSLTHMIINELQTVYNTQLLLDKHGCRYTMLFVHNPFLDCRPLYSPTFQIVWNKKEIISETELETAYNAITLKPVKLLIDKINWSNFASGPTDPHDPKTYTGMWEYFFNKKEYLIYSHDTDPHPISLTHHDFALEKILDWNPKGSPHRDTAIDISRQAMSMHIPEFDAEDYVGLPDKELLEKKFKSTLNELGRY